MTTVSTFYVGTDTKKFNFDIGVMIYANYQKDNLEDWLKTYKGAVLYISKPAMNFTQCHGDSRNVMVIFANEKSNKEDKVSRLYNPWTGQKW